MADDFFKVELSDGSRLSFSNVEEIDQWIKREQDAFKWLIAGGAAAGEQVAQLREHYYGAFNAIRQNLKNLQNNPKDENLRTQFSRSLAGYLNNKRTVRSNNSSVRIASDVAETDGFVAASAAFGTLVDATSAPSFATIKGIVAAIVRRDGINPDSSGIVAKAIDDLNALNAETRSKQNAEWADLTQGANSQLEHTKSTLDATTSEFGSRADAMIAGINEAANEAIKKIEATEASYKAQMQLQAPVEYWASKAQVHKEAIDGWFGSRARLILFAIAGSIALVFALLWLGTNAVTYAEYGKGDTAIYLKFAAIGAIVTTIIFWIGRVLLRIYLSDRHLLTDAEERVAMIKTYLAFSNEGKVDPIDRALILAPIFKSASDGIVRDDGPDTSLGGVLAKLIDVKR